LFRLLLVICCRNLCVEGSKTALVFEVLCSFAFRMRYSSTCPGVQFPAACKVLIARFTLSHKLRQQITNSKRNNKNKTDVDHVQTLLQDPEYKSLILHPTEDIDFPSSTGDWMIVLASNTSLCELVKFGSKIIGLDGCFKLVKYPFLDFSFFFSFSLFIF